MSPRPFDATRRSEAELDLLIDIAGTVDEQTTASRPIESWQLCDGSRRPLSSPFPGIFDACAGRGASVVLMGRGRAIRQARFSIHPIYWIGFERLYKEAVRLVLQAVKDWANRVPNWVLPPPESRPADGRPTIASRLACGVARSALDRVRQWIFDESWMIGVVDQPIANVVAANPSLPIQWIGPRRSSRYLADPFGLPEAPDRLYCEEVLASVGSGTIKELELCGTRIVRERAIPFAGGSHISYPYLFVDDGALYCIPETIAARRCSLYRFDPAHGWSLLAAPLEDGVAAADPTIFRWEDRYWLAYTDADDDAFSVLSLRYSHRLTGPWHRHANNPVKIDHRSARSGGTPFVYGGALFRPAQDCSTAYGGAIAINRVTLCTPTAYREEVVRVLRPQPASTNPDGFHTLSAWGTRTLVDGKRYQVNPIALRRKLLRRLRPFRTRTFPQQVQ